MAGGRFIIVVWIDDKGGNTHHIITEEQHEAWLADEGADEQDREGDSDHQDRENYSISDETTFLDMVAELADDFATWPEAAARVQSLGGTIVNVIAASNTTDS